MKFFEGNELIFRFMLINISSGVAIGMMNFIIPVYALSLNATSTEIGLIKGFTGIGDLLVVLPAGFLVDYFGSRKMYSLGCISGAAIIMSVSFATNPEFLLFIMLFYGISRTIRTTSNNADFFENMSTIGARKAGLFKGSMTIGSSFIGPVIGGIAIVAMGYTSYYALTGAVLLVPLIVLFALANRENNSPFKLKNSSFIDASNHYKNLVKNRILVSAAIIDSLNGAFFMTFTAFVSVLVIRDLGMSPGIAAMLLSLKGGATILVVFFGGALLSRNNNGLYLFAFIATILGLLLLGVGKDITQFGIASVILGIGSGLLTLVTFTQVGNIDGEKGKIAGIFSFIHAIGAIVGPIFGGVIGDAFGVRTIFLVFMLPFGVLAVYTFMNGKRN